MSESHFLIYNHKKRPITLKAERISLYLQSEVIEAISENNEIYYLFFYKNKFLTALKARKLRRNSFIEDVFKKGIIFKAPHPFINALLSTNHPCQIVDFDNVLRKLKNNYSPQEKAFILTFFESFIPKKQLFQEIQSVYYEYRRNGQNFLSYHIIEILLEFVPKHSWVKQLTSDLAFKNYTATSNENSGNTFVERKLFSKIDEEYYFQQLVNHLERESRWINLIALYIYKLTPTPSINYYQPLVKTLERHFSEEETLHILESLSQQFPSYLPLKKDLFDNYLKIQKLEEVSRLMAIYQFQLTDSQIDTYNELLENWEPQKDIENLEVLQPLLKSILNVYPENAEKLLHTFVTSLLKTHELTDVKEWLAPFKEDHKNLEVFNKVDSMKRLSQDLDQMQKLGELYYEFHQFDKGIECFSWEMELKPTDPKPLHWLSRVYREKGMTEESDAFQKLCSNLHRRD
ncbi:hypothetical protein [Halalkalibacter urbisdiaboli]|uniref:hypothetical protein n=1 Tax=Halalkalibacter urbisdiaboli TaxID=1960589 RepID=UPI000B43BF59|nr:hypothetical protein [Halalkalibacter urbisdiaboli]